MKEISVNRLKWRCRRGMKELDVLLESYLLANADCMVAETRRSFSELLEVQDPILYEWFTGRSKPDKKELHDLIIAIGSLR